MTDTTQATVAAEADATEDVVELNPLAGIASFAGAESAEILNLLGDQASGGSCCGGSCCA